MTDCSIAPFYTGWSTSQLTPFQCWQPVSTPHNATVESWNTGAQGTEGWPGSRSTRTCLDGCASKNTHQSSHITSLPGRLIGWRRRQGRGNAKNRRGGPFWLNEPMRHQCAVQVPPLPQSWLGEKRVLLAQAPAFTRLLCVFHRDLHYITHVQPHRYMTNIHT